MGDERSRTSELKARLVEGRLGEAISESEVDLRSLHSRITNACEIDNLQELQQFVHRLTAIEKIATSLEEHMSISAIRVRLQHVVQELARVQEMFMRYGAP